MRKTQSIHEQQQGMSDQGKTEATVRKMLIPAAVSICSLQPNIILQQVEDSRQVKQAEIHHTHQEFTR